MTSHRIAHPHTLDADRPLSFQFDGTSYQGFSGDSLASALLANGVRLIGRSFKYHRPRGFLAAGPEEPNGLMQLGTGAFQTPNIKATVQPLYDGLIAQSQNRWPSLAFDVMGINDMAAGLLAAGFYYKTFMWPASFWEKIYEPLIRRAAGLGKASGAPDPDTYAQGYLFCDCLVIGAGPAGLISALASARAGLRVIVCEQDFALGGRLLSERNPFADHSAQDWLAAVIAELSALPNVQIFSNTMVFGHYDGGTFGAIESKPASHADTTSTHPRQILWRIVARHAVLASGAIERPQVFSGNDRPGIMLGSAIRTYLHRYGVACGRTTMVATSQDEGWQTAFDLHHAGQPVVGIAESRPDCADTLKAQARQAGIPVFLNARITETTGHLSLNSVTVTHAQGRTLLQCDTIAMSNGWTPTIHLTCHHGNKPRWDATRSMFLADRLPQGLCVAGAAAGETGHDATLRSALTQTQTILDAMGKSMPALTLPRSIADTVPSASFFMNAEIRKAFVDFQHDVTSQDVALAYREGYRSVEHLKRYTTLGMGTDQGKTSNTAGLALMASLCGLEIADVGTTVFRPPYEPVAIGALAGPHHGPHYRTTRLGAAHQEWVAADAVFVEAGQWLRPQYFPQAGETHWRQSVDREVLQTRRAVGLCDVSTLGKIEVTGRDALAFLDFVYCNPIASLSVGKCRYGLMLREDGFVYDDGTIARLADTHFVITTTTAQAGAVMNHLDYCHQMHKPNWDVRMTSVSERFSQFALAGPQARDVLAAVFGAYTDVTDAGLPYLGCVEVPLSPHLTVRLFRLSFSGERAYEIAIPSPYARSLVRALREAGRAYGLVLYGTEALGVMRIEKGHVAGNELNGMTTARDLGLGRMVSRKKDFIGRVLAQRPALIDPDRPQLVGVQAVDPHASFGAGAHFIAQGAPHHIEHDEGYITSVAYSPHAQRLIGLGLIKNGPQRHGDIVVAYDQMRGQHTLVELVDPCFYDREGVRLHG